nr:DUF1786 domain-containing protein [Desulfovibrio inopinatus]
MTPGTLCIDIGSGTQDALLYYPDRELENCPKFILESPARMVAARIRELGQLKMPIYLYGNNMGGGFYRSIKAHLAMGLDVSARRDAAYSLSDNPESLLEMGIRLDERCPDGFMPVYLSDFDPAFWDIFLKMSGHPYPSYFLIAAQDHGFHPGSSNRMGRFELWRHLLEQADGRPESLIYDTPPETFTRLRSIEKQAGACMTADTGAAAILGALFVPEIEEASRDHGVLVLNMGNSHIVAAMVYAGRIYGVYEHHTGVLDPGDVMLQIDRFRRGTLACEEVFDSYGHGCLCLPPPSDAGGFDDIHVIGPKREQLMGYHVSFPSPGGDMMLAGCFGLLKGRELKRLAAEQN